MRYKITNDWSAAEDNEPAIRFALAHIKNRFNFEEEMRAYGNVKKIKSNFPDNHPPKGYINWWEDMKSIWKKKERQLAKKEIRNELA